MLPQQNLKARHTFPVQHREQQLTSCSLDNYLPFWHGILNSMFHHEVMWHLSECSFSLLSAMTAYVQLRTHLNEKLRADILLLSSYLSGQTCALKSDSVDPTLALYADIATLLTICNDPTWATQNVTAVIGNHTTRGMDFFVYIETTGQMDACFTRQAASTQDSPGERAMTFHSGSSYLSGSQNARLHEGGSGTGRRYCLYYSH